MAHQDGKGGMPTQSLLAWGEAVGGKGGDADAHSDVERVAWLDLVRRSCAECVSRVYFVTITYRIDYPRRNVTLLIPGKSYHVDNDHGWTDGEFSLR